MICAALVGVAVAVGLTWMLLLAVARMPGRRGGGGLARDITTRFMGLIVLAMGVQFVLAGYEAFTKAA
jgi:multiple antibiotic resistance protein